MKVISGALPYQIWIEKVFFVQKVMLFAVPMKYSSGDMKYFFM